MLYCRHGIRPKAKTLKQVQLIEHRRDIERSRVWTGRRVAVENARFFRISRDQFQFAKGRFGPDAVSRRTASALSGQRVLRAEAHHRDHIVEVLNVAVRRLIASGLLQMFEQLDERHNVDAVPVVSLESGGVVVALDGSRGKIRSSDRLKLSSLKSRQIEPLLAPQILEDAPKDTLDLSVAPIPRRHACHVCLCLRHLLQAAKDKS